MKLGICKKCGQKRKVVMHHEHGYDEEHFQDVTPYCVSCHRKAHIRARREGKCSKTPAEIERLSIKSSYARSCNCGSDIDVETLRTELEKVQLIISNKESKI